MPCYDGRDMDRGPSYHDEYLEEKRAKEQAEAMLCAVLSVVEVARNVPINSLDDALSRINWQEAGIKQGQLVAWWKKHKKLDAERRAREKKAAAARAKQAAANKRRIELKKAALAKLTADERKALGLKD